MKAVEYTTTISEKGVLPLPKEILQELNIMKNSKIKVVLLYEGEPGKKDLARFCGKWQDERDAHTIIKETIPWR
ncbi:MAG: hypothetical protein PF690_13505 [Deltaproteobacteria bacterium]|jgi:hypothetical protein|nr:hypothetical protein [Deltaproteobacteria bacterium]